MRLVMSLKVLSGKLLPELGAPRCIELRKKHNIPARVMPIHMHMPSLTPLPGQVRMINKLGDSERVFQVLKEAGRGQVYIKGRRMRRSQMDETFGSR